MYMYTDLGRPGIHLRLRASKKKEKKRSCVSIWSGQKCDRKWISDIQNGRRQAFSQKFQKKIMLENKLLFVCLIQISFHYKPKLIKYTIRSHNKVLWSIWRVMPSAALLFCKWNFIVFRHRTSFWAITLYYRSEMARKAIKSEFRTSKMGAGAFCKKNIKKFRIDLKWPEMWPKVIFGHPKWPAAAILLKKNTKLWYWFEMRYKVIFGHPKWLPAVI